MSSRDTKIKRTLLESGIGFLVAIYVMSSRDTKIKRTLLESGLGLLAKEYEENQVTDVCIFVQEKNNYFSKDSNENIV